MTNYEKYKSEIMDPMFDRCDFMQYYLPNQWVDCCRNREDCDRCTAILLKWAQEEYQTEWHRLPVNSLVYVWNEKEEDKKKAYFACYLDDQIFVFADSKTSKESVQPYQLEGYYHGEIIKDK